MLDKIRQSLRFKTTSHDDEIQRNIDTCIDEMKLAGINTNESDQLIIKACELYNKAEFDYNGKGEQYRKNYKNLKDAMSLSIKYKENKE